MPFNSASSDTLLCSFTCCGCFVSSISLPAAPPHTRIHSQTCRTSQSTSCSWTAHRRESTAVEGEETLQDLRMDGSKTWTHLFHQNRFFQYHCSQLHQSGQGGHGDQVLTRKLSNALAILTSDKRMVATSDYNEFHKTVKKHILGNVLRAAAQKRHRLIRENLVENILSQFGEHVKTSSDLAVNFRNIFTSELFILALKQRDFFPYLRWIPNSSVENKIQNLYFRREVVMKALMIEQKKRVDSGKVLNCLFDYLVSEAKELSEHEISMLLWETIVETCDTTLVTTEWAMYELAKDKTRQARLYAELQNVCGEEKVTEEQLSKLPYLGAVFHETLRKYSRSNRANKICS